MPNDRLFIKTDRQRLKQILINLLTNAIKYNIAGGQVFIKTEPSPNNELGTSFIRISITDTGLGISKKDLPKLFNLLKGLAPKSHKSKGPGLDLP